MRVHTHVCAVLVCLRLLARACVWSSLVALVMLLLASDFTSRVSAPRGTTCQTTSFKNSWLGALVAARPTTSHQGRTRHVRVPTCCAVLVCVCVCMCVCEVVMRLLVFGGLPPLLTC